MLISVLAISPALAGEKAWDGGGDGLLWADEDNWFPGVVPNSSDDVTIDTEDAEVTCDRTFKVKSITVGGRETVTLTSENFVYGTVKPDSRSDTAISNRAGGTITLEGAGVLTLMGKYEDSEASLTPEPSFLFWVE